ncbi:MAG: hypothetical protein MOGMAGMI_02346 [Candidatus Omnitrophica bacterium]|nr:hypothetical protein [Candidatus Omnitrophota bacterium]
MLEAVKSAYETVRLAVKHGLGVTIAILNTLFLGAVLYYVLTTSHERELKLTNIIEQKFVTMDASIALNTQATNSTATYLKSLNDEVRDRYASIIKTGEATAAVNQRIFEALTTMNERLRYDRGR